MSGLSAFMAENVTKGEIVKVVVSPRFVDEGKPVEWEIRTLTAGEDEAIRKSCTRKVPAPGKKGLFTQETDYDKYLGKLAVACVQYPNLNNADLQDSYKAMGADELLKKMLLPGEYADLLRKVNEVNGFELGMDELVEEAKN